MSRWGWLSRLGRVAVVRTTALVRRTARDRRIADLRRQLEAATVAFQAAKNDEQRIGPGNDIRTLTADLRSELAAARTGSAFEDEVRQAHGAWFPGGGSWHAVDLERGGLGDLFRDSRYPTGTSGGGSLRLPSARDKRPAASSGDGLLGGDGWFRR